MQIDYKHTLADDDARARLHVLGEYLHNRHGIKVAWLDPDRATFSGKYLVVKIDGELSAAPGLVKFRGHDPGFLWRKRATEYIEGKLNFYLDPTKPLDTLPRGGLSAAATSAARGMPDAGSRRRPTGRRAQAFAPPRTADCTACTTATSTTRCESPWCSSRCWRDSMIDQRLKDRRGRGDWFMGFLTFENGRRSGNHRAAAGIPALAPRRMRGAIDKTPPTPTGCTAPAA